MLTYIIYFSIFVILVFVLTIAVKAITRGVEAKQILKDEKNFEANKESANETFEVVSQIKELKDLQNKGIINEEEFKKAKEKILK
tara:strand:+ start:418 stop:672 length:255 start_codon:yes stop_codon:yes gene_type:complete